MWHLAKSPSAIALGVTALSLLAVAASGAPAVAKSSDGPSRDTRTPIKHLVVIFQENVSFDHYFATYPVAANVAGETLQGTGVAAPAFTASATTPTAIDTLGSAGLLAPNNPNSVQPFRLTPAQAVTCDQDHHYQDEQKAYNGGLMDKFVENTTRDSCSGLYGAPGLVMGYYDGNTVMGLWNYAQQYAMSDNSYSTTFGPSTPGALNLVAGQTHGVRSYDPVTRQLTTAPDPYTVRIPDANGVGTVINDPDPVWDDCSSTAHPVAGMDGTNIGDLLNANGTTWGWFEGGFRPTTSAADASNGRAVCGSVNTNVGGLTSSDYIPHHEPFQYYASTANPHHLPPSSTAMIGKTDQANHQYDMTDFSKVVDGKNMPAVSFLKAPGYQDGHAAYSDPIDEQHFLVDTINQIQASPNWKDTAIIVLYDDSDGWYDHTMANLTNASNSVDDAALCTDAASAGVSILGGYQDRCGPGTRQPFLVISPYAKTNFVDHTQTDQSSVTQFIEDNWGTGRIGDGSTDAGAGSIVNMFNFHGRTAPTVMLNPQDGTVASISGKGDNDHGRGSDAGKEDSGHGRDAGSGRKGGRSLA
ncbi:phospholipase C [Demequina lutea]|uniref:Phospholipase C n=1 Tax=Demequina lutea TaxID=431489 RepID=A0A7Y9Z9V0_9MICO|nr:alkaline phosphatase family protein [Demequina lutea]NYI40895.1 phospholipase C [Demequina lutea]